jgi:hypothetical protein
MSQEVDPAGTGWNFQANGTELLFKAKDGNADELIVRRDGLLLSTLTCFAFYSLDGTAANCEVLYNGAATGTRNVDSDALAASTIGGAPLQISGIDGGSTGVVDGHTAEFGLFHAPMDLTTFQGILTSVVSKFGL